MNIANDLGWSEQVIGHTCKCSMSNTKSIASVMMIGKLSMGSEVYTGMRHELATDRSACGLDVPAMHIA